jgi:hypothetical protein
MSAVSYIVIPKTEIKLYDGDVVTITTRPGVEWYIHKGWYEHAGVSSFGWYLIDKDHNTLPVETIDLTLCSLVTKLAAGSIYNDGAETYYSSLYTDYDADMLNRGFVSVDTIIQIDNLDRSKLTNGKIVRVNDYGGTSAYFAWNTTTDQWDEIDFGSSGDKEIYYGTTEYWNQQPQLLATKGKVYVYSDHIKNTQGQNIPGVKVGDGTSYLIDMPFTDSEYAEHILNSIVHITQEDRDAWNNKVRCYIEPKNSQHLIFTTK